MIETIRTHDKNETHDRTIANNQKDPNDGNEINQTKDANIFTKTLVRKHECNTRKSDGVDFL